MAHLKRILLIVAILTFPVGCAVRPPQHPGDVGAHEATVIRGPAIR